jgi:nitroreductase
MQLEEAIKSRKSVKRFLDKKPDWRKIIQAVDYVRFTPMAGNMFTIKLILVSDEKSIEKIKQAAQQDFVRAPYVLVVTSDREKVKKLYDTSDKGFAQQQAGAAIQNILLGLTEKGISTCWVGFFDDDIVRETLEIPKSQTIEAIFPLGIETKIKTNSKAKPDLENFFYFDKFGNKRMAGETRVSHEKA